MDRSGLSAGEWLFVVVAGAAMATAGVVWAGASLAAAAAGESLGATLPDAVAALAGLVGSPGDPAAAWGDPFTAALPGPVLYWAATGLCAAAAAGVLVLALRLVAGSGGVGPLRRRPLGVDARARFATARDLAPLAVAGPAPGRLVLGWAAGRLVATESRPADGRRSKGRRRRRGDRGAVALVGPSRSGKTTAAVSGILGWDGPAVLASVKDDLLRNTIGWRSRRGQVAVSAPPGRPGRPAGPGSPLRGADTTLGAGRAARALCDAAPRGEIDGGDSFWLAQSELLLSGLLFVAAASGRDMGSVCDWVLRQDRPGAWGPGEVRLYLDVLLDDPDPAVRQAAKVAARSLSAVWEDEERTRSGVYATARTAILPWSDPAVAATTAGRSVDLEWLMAGPNTLYLCAPIEDQRRLAPAFGGLLNDLIRQVYLRVAETGRPLDPPLLVVIDEAGNTPLAQLPEYASTLAGFGVVLVTIWQSLAQLEATYGRQAGTVLTNHLSKVFYSSLSDVESLRYLAEVLGDVEAPSRSRSADVDGGRASVQTATQRSPLVPPHAIRQARPGDALLIHGSLPPAHLRTLAWFEDRELRARASLRDPHTDHDQGGTHDPNYHATARREGASPDTSSG